MKRMRMAMAIAGTGMVLANVLSAQSAMKPFHFEETTTGDVQAAYQAHALTATQLVQAYLISCGCKDTPPAEHDSYKLEVLGGY